MKLCIFIVSCLLLASLLRLYRLGEYPQSLYGDELAFAWNAYSISLTGADEYNIPHPLLFRSFDDYKLPIPVYLLVPFIRLFGLNSFSIRLPIAIAGIATVWITYFLIRQFLSRKVALLGMFLMSISPWHIHLSRGYFESTLSLMFTIAAVWLFLSSKGKFYQIVISGVLFICSIYTYFTPRIYIPFLVPFLTIISFLMLVNKWNISKKILIRNMLGMYFVILIASIPLISAMLTGNGMERFRNLSGSQQSYVIDRVMRDRRDSALPISIKILLHNKFSVTAETVVNNYLEHWSIGFWYFAGDSSLRYFLGNMGLFYLWELPFVVIGTYLLYRNHKTATIILLGWLAIMPVPAALVGKPFAVRSLSMLPVPFVFAAYGISDFIHRIGRKYASWAAIFISLVAMVSVSVVLLRYYFDYPVYAATWWGWENKTAIDYAFKYGDRYDQVFLSDFYTGMPLALSVYGQFDPKLVRNALDHRVMLADGREFIKIGKYYIGSLDLNSERLKNGLIPKGSLYIGRPEEPDSAEQILSPGSKRVIFNVFRSPR